MNIIGKLSSNINKLVDRSTIPREMPINIKNSVLHCKKNYKKKGSIASIIKLDACAERNLDGGCGQRHNQSNQSNEYIRLIGPTDYSSSILNQ